MGVIGVFWTSDLVQGDHAKVKLFIDGNLNIISENAAIVSAKSGRYVKD